MISKKILKLKKYIGNKQLIIVSKNRTIKEILNAYNTGHRDFGENRVQELIQKHATLPKDINWHMIGHLQKNKVKYIIPFIHLIHSVDSIELLEKINLISKKQGKITHCLIQIKIAKEKSKFGMTEQDVKKLLASDYINQYEHTKINGLMGMASASNNKEEIKKEFEKLKNIYSKNKNFNTLCMGMSQDYKIANQIGSNMFRIGSYIFH